MAIFLFMLVFASLLAGGECLSGSYPRNVQLTDADIELTALSVLEMENEQLKEQLKQVTSELSRISTRVQSLEDRTLQQIGFHAEGLMSVTPLPTSSNVINYAWYNVGNAFDSTTGNFTAPVPGLYFFMASITTESGDDIFYGLGVDDFVLSRAYAHAAGARYDSATVHVVVHLTAGQTVWLMGYGHSNISGKTTFSGALLSPDP